MILNDGTNVLPSPRSSRAPERVPPESGPGSSTEVWAEFLMTHFNLDEVDLDGLNRDEMIALYHDLT